MGCLDGRRHSTVGGEGGQSENQMESRLWAWGPGATGMGGDCAICSGGHPLMLYPCTAILRGCLRCPVSSQPHCTL